MLYLVQLGTVKGETTPNSAVLVTCDGYKRGDVTSNALNALPRYPGV